MPLLATCMQTFFQHRCQLNTKSESGINSARPKGYGLKALTQRTLAKATPALRPILSTCGESSPQREARAQQPDLQRVSR